MTDKIAEIRARNQRIETTDVDALLVNLEFSWANADRKWLLAEVEKLTRERDEARAEVERLRAALRWYADLSNHLPVECRDPGDPDPAVVVLDEPPILRDNGTLARAALEAKP